MSNRLARLLIAVMIVMLAGFMLFPVMFPSYAERKPVAKQEKPQQPVRRTTVDDWQRDDTLVDSDDDDAWKTEEHDDGDGNTRRGLGAQDDDSYDEEDVPEDPRQKKVTEARVHAQYTSALAHAKQLAKIYEKTEPQRLIKNDYPAEAWADPDSLYQSLAEKTLDKMGKLSDDEILTFLEKPENCLDLARITLIRKVGTQGLRGIHQLPKGGELLSKLTADLNWIQGLLYSGPTTKLEQAVINLEKLYTRTADKDREDPVVQKTMTTTALEFAREGWNEQDMLARYDYYYKSYKEDLLNDVFAELQYWDMRLVTGCREGDSVNPSWGGPKNLAWMRDNVRLPADRYLGAEGQLQYRLRNVAGDSVFSAAYLAPIWDYTDHITAWAHREIGGVCGALSHYATYAALASGIPATTMGEPGHCSYAVRVGNEWKAGNSIYWQKGVHKNMWGESGWDYLVLLQELYQDRYTTLVSDQMIAMADFLGARKKMTASFSTYEIGIKVQPLNWPGLRRYSGYLKIKAPKDYEKWMVLHDTIAEGLGASHHFAAATLLTHRVYPNLVPLVKDKNRLNKMFAGLFKNFKDWGTNRWDVTEVLDAQIATCQNKEEQKAYLRECLRVLMAQKDYSGAVLTWGLGYISKLPDDGDEKVQDEFTNMLIFSMRRAGTDKKNKDATWSTLGEAMYAAAKNHERKTFQAIGKLTYTKCKEKFPKKGQKFRAFPGKVVSTTALINTATTIGDTSDCALHWGVLQRFGGSMPGKFEGTSGVTVDLDSKCEINGVISIMSENKLKTDRAWYLEMSDDGQNWHRVAGNGVVDGNTIRFDTRKEKPTCKFLRMLREGDKYEPGVTGFYVYGKNLKS